MSVDSTLMKDNGTDNLLWLNAGMPMLTFVRRMNITKAVRISKRKKLKLTVLLTWCALKAAADCPEFYSFVQEHRLVYFDMLAARFVYKTSQGRTVFCTVPYNSNLEAFHQNYVQMAAECDRNNCGNVFPDCAAIDISAIPQYPIDGVSAGYSELLRNPFMLWGKYQKRFLCFYLPVSFKFDHAQMDGVSAASFLDNMQKAIFAL